SGAGIDKGVGSGCKAAAGDDETDTIGVFSGVAWTSRRAASPAADCAIEFAAERPRLPIPARARPGSIRTLGKMRTASESASSAIAAGTRDRGRRGGGARLRDEAR